MKKHILFAAGLFLLTAGSAFAALNCLRIDSIDRWTSTDNKTLIVTDNWHQKFKVTLLGYCPNLSYRERLGIKSFGGTALSCVAAGDNVFTREFGTGVQRCPIRKVEVYTPEMMKADADAAAAKKAAEGSH